MLPGPPQSNLPMQQKMFWHEYACTAKWQENAKQKPVCLKPL
jgi:hypothetical protein